MKTLIRKTKQALRNLNAISLLVIALGFTLVSNAQTWGTQNSLITDDINGVHFSKSVNTGFAVASGGRIIKTTNSGMTWILQNSGTVKNLYGVCFSNNNSDTGYIVGDSGMVLMTRNGGTNWDTISSGTTEQLNDVSIKDGDGYIVGNNGVILRVSGGTITSLTSNTTSNLYGVNMVNKTTAVVAGGGILSPILLITYNSGNVWTPVATGAARQFNDVCFVNDSTMYVVGNGGAILKTTNYGATWNTQSVGSAITNLNAVCFVNKDTGFVAGVTGNIFRTVNAGTSWTAAVSGTTSNLMDISFTDAYRGYAGGSGGTMIRTCPTVLFDPMPNDSVCVNTVVSFTNQSKNSTSYIWIKDGDTVSTNLNYAYQFDTIGNFSIRLTADNGTCQSSLLKVMNVVDNPEVDLGPDTTICSTCTIQLDAGNPGSTYTWYRNGVATGVVSRTNTVGVAGTYRVDVKNANGCISSDSVVVSISSGVKAISGNIADFNVYPNPNNKLFVLDFTIQRKQETAISIMNIMGDVVYSENLKGFSGKYSNSISLESFSSGVYFVKVQSGETTQTTKLLMH
ncbi:MAG: YCF48-related protein [Bacteroidota bacterium]